MKNEVFDMKKSLLVLLPLLMLFGCNSKSSVTPTSRNGESNKKNNNEVSSNELTTTISIPQEDYFQHFTYAVSIDSRSQSDYAQRPTITYTTTVKITISQLRTGYVTYSGTGSFKAQLDWTYETSDGNGNVINAPKSDTFTIPYSTQDHLTSFTSEKIYTTSHTGNSSSSWKIESEMPYKNTYDTKHNPSCIVTVSTLSLQATYYKNGVSGDHNLFVKSYEITTANYLSYFSISDNRLYPTGNNKLYDYRVSFTINDQKYTTRRDGTCSFALGSDGVSAITKVEGFIDVYPDRVI